MYGYLCCLLSLVVYLVTQNKYICAILLQSVASTVVRTLVPSHKSPVIRGPTTKTSDENLVVRAPGLSFKCYFPFCGCHVVS